MQRRLNLLVRIDFVESVDFAIGADNLANSIRFRSQIEKFLWNFSE